MNKTNITNEMLKDIFDKMFKTHTEKILITNEYGESEEKDIDKFLNILFYAWSERLKDKSGKNYLDYGSWVESLEYSFNEAYALVEIVDAGASVSMDMDAGQVDGAVRFIIQTDKIKALDYYCRKLRGYYLGRPETIQNEYGDKITAYISIGLLMYDGEPFTSQYGEVLEVSLGFSINYLTTAQGYADTKTEFSLQGDDLYNEDGVIVNDLGEPTETKYLQVPMTRSTWNLVFTGDPVSTETRPDLTGIVNKATTFQTTMSFFDFNKKLSKELNKIFWSSGANRINGVPTAKKDVNIPIYIRVTIDDDFYVYKMVCTGMEKVVQNGEFNTTSLTVKTWGKIN